jgi:hypothetical protein
MIRQERLVKAYGGRKPVSVLDGFASEPVRALSAPKRVGQVGRVRRISAEAERGRDVVKTLGRLWLVLALFAAGCLVFAGRAFAQTGSAPALEFTGGYAGFIDDSTIEHGLFGVAARWAVTPRLGIGPEITYMIGPQSDRDLFVTGNVTWDLVRPVPVRAGLVVPYVLGGAGFFRHSNRFGSSSFASSEGTFSAGGGARVWLSPRVYVGGEARFGWELHTRFAATVGVQLGR